MPNRILRDTTDSEPINKLSSNAEVLFYRLMMKADDYGVFHARTSLIKASLYPLRLDTVRESDISRWLAECEKAGLIAFYEADSKPYLVIVKFGQRMRNMKKRFPDPPEHLTASCRELPLEIETRNENLETERETKSDCIYSFEKTKEMFFGEGLLIEHTCKEKQVKEQVAMFYMQKFWDRQCALQSITTRSYSDLKRHYVNSLPKMKLTEIENKGEGTYKSKGI